MKETTDLIIPFTLIRWSSSEERIFLLSSTTPLSVNSILLLHKILASGRKKMWMMEKIGKSRVEAFMSWFVKVHPHEISLLFYSTSTFFFVSSARLWNHLCMYLMCLCFYFERLTFNIFWFADFECIFCGSSFAGWRSHIIRIGEFARAFCRIFATYLGCCPAFHTNFLIA